MNIQDNICICCSMPTIDYLQPIYNATILANAQSTKASEAYNKCSGVNHSELPAPVNLNPKICTVCLMQLEMAYKFYDRCMQTRASYHLLDQPFVACRGCECPDNYMDGTQLYDMEERDILSNGAVVKCIDAFFQFCGLSEQERLMYEYYKICQTCLSHLENAYIFREFCRNAFRILQRKNAKKPNVMVESQPKLIETQPRSAVPLLVPVLSQPPTVGKEESKALVNIKVEEREETEKVDMVFERLDLDYASDRNDMFYDELADPTNGYSSVEESKPEVLKIDKEKKKRGRKKKREKKTKKSSKKITVQPDCPPLRPMPLDEVGSTIVQEPVLAPAPYKCDVCLTTYDRLRFLKMHQRRHKNNPNYKVTRIRKKPPKTNEYRRLGRNCRTEQEYRVELRQAREERVIIEGEPFVCDLCAAKFLKINTLRVHMEKKHIILDDKQKHLCNQCGQLFKLKSKLAFHMEVHRQSKYRCTLCSSSYTYEKDLKRHMFSHTGGRPGFSDCPICKKSLKTDSIEVHVNNVHVEKKHACDKCNSRFVKKDELWMHQFDHLGFLPFSCAEVDRDGQLCEFATKKKQSYQVHLLKKHNIIYNEAAHGYNELRSDVQRELHAEKDHVPKKANNYHCEKCDKGFHTMTGLYHHRRIDHLKVMFKCGFAECGRSFTQKPALWSHSFVHRNLFPYNCEAFGCSYQSRNKKSFQIHLKKDHDINYKEDVHGYKKESFQQVIDFAMNPQMNQTLQYGSSFQLYD